MEKSAIYQRLYYLAMKYKVTLPHIIDSIDWGIKQLAPIASAFFFVKIPAHA